MNDIKNTELGALTEQTVRARAQEIIALFGQGEDKVNEAVAAAAQAEAASFTGEPTLARVNSQAQAGYSDVVIYTAKFVLFSPYGGSPAQVVYDFRRQVQEAAANLIVEFLAAHNINAAKEYFPAGGGLHGGFTVTARW